MKLIEVIRASQATYLLRVDQFKRNNLPLKIMPLITRVFNIPF